MATSKALLLIGVLATATAGAREASSPAACKAAGAQPVIAAAKRQLSQDPDDIKSTYRLADAWSDAGCFNDALQVLQEAARGNNDKELQTRLRVARSVVGEEHYFDNLDRAADAARLKRAVFRCRTLNDLDACNDAVRNQPDDAQLVIAQGDALLHAKRPGEALTRYELAQGLGATNADVAAKIAAAEDLARSRGPAAVANAVTTPTPTASTAPTAPTAPTSGAPTSGAPASGAPANGAPAKAETHLAAAPPPRAPYLAADRPPRRYSNLAPEGQSH